MERTLEPEIMDDRDAARAYAHADFSDSNRTFIEYLITHFPSPLREVVDLGTGPADVPVQLARALPSVRVTAVDGSREMLAIAGERLRSARLEGRIELHLGRMPGLALPERAFDAVLCKDMLHHLADPQVLWSEARRLARPGAAIVVMDLMRPHSPEQARAIVEQVAGGEHPVLKTDFYHSLLAAFTVEEVRAQLHGAGLELTVTRASDRHLMVRGLLP